MNKSSYLAVCTTNQPVIARGDLTESENFSVTCKLDFELGANGAYLDDLFFVHIIQMVVFRAKLKI